MELQYVLIVEDLSTYSLAPNILWVEKFLRELLSLRLGAAWIMLYVL